MESAYHYTNWQGLLGVLSSRQMWVSDSQFLNDPQELRYAIEAICQSLEDRRESFESVGRAAAVHDLVRALKGRCSEHGVFNAVREDIPFIASFCDNGDLLSMWRGYASGGGLAVLPREVVNTF